MQISRRDFLKLSAASCALPLLLRNNAFGADFWSLPRTLHLRRGREEVRATYWANGQLIEDGYIAVCKIMRDVQAGVTVQIDPVLLDILHGMQGWFSIHGQSRILQINSGFRTRETNAKEGGRLNSWHLKAAAADVVFPGVPVDYIAQLAMYFGRGGVGIYRSKNFVHVDRGSVRTFYG